MIHVGIRLPVPKYFQERVTCYYEAYYLQLYSHVPLFSIIK